MEVEGRACLDIDAGDVFHDHPADDSHDVVVHVATDQQKRKVATAHGRGPALHSLLPRRAAIPGDTRKMASPSWPHSSVAAD